MSVFTEVEIALQQIYFHYFFEELAWLLVFYGISTLESYLMPNPVYTHTHTHTHIYIYIYIYDL